MNYIVSQRALDLIELECRRNPDTETGGILVGSRDANQLSITHATGPGLQWEASSYHFVKDTEYLQSVLKILFEYFGVNYLGVWHKHPRSMPHPSDGDISSAMEEVTDVNMGLEELVTPICIMESGHVQVLPFVIKDDVYKEIEWEPIAHNKLPMFESLQRQWYDTEGGNKRLIEELARFDNAGVQIELLKGNDNTYRIDVTLAPESGQRMVVLCPAEYPAIAPEVAIYSEGTNEYEPFRSDLLDGWNIYTHLVDVAQEYQGSSYQGRLLPPRNWVRHGHQAAKLLHTLAKTGVFLSTWLPRILGKISYQTGQLEKWFDDRDKWERTERKGGG